MGIEICGDEGLYLPEGNCECPEGGGPSIERILYADLKAMRDAGELTPGQMYRIIDYEATTTQPYTSVVPHSFDIIVTADSENTLNENATAMLRRNDSYYNASDSCADLSAWRLKYTVDNDQDRYAWADPTHGKGVVFYMEDENNNVAPYDFKQIVFRINQINECTALTELASNYGSDVIGVFDGVIEYGTARMAYTFSVIDDQTGEVFDLSVKNKKYKELTSRNYVSCNNNVIKPAIYNNSEAGLLISSPPYVLNHIVIVEKSSVIADVYGNTFDINCVDDVLNDKCINNSFGSEFTNNIAYDISDNTFARSADANLLWGFSGNITGNSFVGNALTASYSNTFGNEVSECVLYGFNYNQVGNIFGKIVMHNPNLYAESNTFGNRMVDVEFMCPLYYNTFENNIRASVFVSTDEIHNYPMQNYKVLEGTTSNHTGISVVPLRTFTTFIGPDSNNTLKQWVPADSVT